MTDDPNDTLVDDIDGCWLDYEHQQALAEIRKFFKCGSGYLDLGHVRDLYDRFFEENGTPK